VQLFFDETCGKFPGCRFLHYNIARSRRVLGPEDYAAAARRHPNLVAVKQMQGDRAALVRFLEAAPELQFILSEEGYCRIRRTHECGLLVSLALPNLDLVHQLLGAPPEVLDELRPMIPPMLSAALAAAEGRSVIDAAYDKMYIKIHLPDFPLRLLPPYSPISDPAFAAYRDRLAAHQPSEFPPSAGA
jgi:hypothetical protein